MRYDVYTSPSALKGFLIYSSISYSRLFRCFLFKFFLGTNS